MSFVYKKIFVYVVIGMSWLGLNNMDYFISCQTVSIQLAQITSNSYPTSFSWTILVHKEMYGKTI